MNWTDAAEDLLNSILAQTPRPEREAAEAGMLHGSPTLLIDGVDPFAQPGAGAQRVVPALPDAAGHLAGAPPVEALRQALAAAGHD